MTSKTATDTTEAATVAMAFLRLWECNINELAKTGPAAGDIPTDERPDGG